MSDVPVGLRAKIGCTLLNGIDSAQALAVTKAFIAKPKEPY
jgi:hypothetical protein